MSTVKTTLLFIASITPALLLTGNAFSGTDDDNRKTVYSVNFDNAQSHDKILRDIESQVDNAESSSGLEILLYGKGAALLIKPGEITNTKLQLGHNSAQNSNQENASVKTRVRDLKNRGVVFITCEQPSNTGSRRKKNIYTVGNSGKIDSTESELTRLKSLGYICSRH